MWRSEILRPSHARSDIARRRFSREVAVLRQLQHPNVVGFLDAGEVEGRLYMVMEYVRGVRLGRLVQSSGPLDAPLAAAIGLATADALAYIHARGFFRNDVKPASAMVTPEGRLCLIDFGIAKPVADDGNVTQVGSFVGTPNYAAPEVWNGWPADARTDVYALGAMLFELVTGTVPFVRDSRSALERAHMRDAPAFTPAAAALPAPLGAAILRCLEKKPDDRFASMTELREALRPFTSPEGDAALRQLVQRAAGAAVLHDAGTRIMSAAALKAVPESLPVPPAREDVARMPPGPALRIVRGTATAGRVVALGTGRAWIGRAPDCDVLLTDAGVSRFHASIKMESTGCMLEDLNSANGILLNGVRITSSHVLQQGDHIAIGECVLEFLGGASAARRYAAGAS